MDLTTFAFIVLGVTALILSGFLITRRWPVSAAMLLIATFIVLAGMYGLLEAHFAAATQVIVYAGAIMVVFVFVIMLLNLPPEEMRYGKVTLGEWLLVFAGISSALLFGTHLGQGAVDRILPGISPSVARAPYYPLETGENVKNVATLMFTEYLWAFELVSFLILVAIIGSVVIAKKRSQHA